MILLKNIDDIQKMIDDGVQEGTSLDYKSAINKSSGKDWKQEIAKDVSAMANANGGIIIYGVKEFSEPEKKHLPEKITPIDSTSISREQLEDIIHRHISPKIVGIEITTIICAEAPNNVVYVVNIPKGDTAHQNLLDLKYHRRRNTTISAMEDYEIRDVMNRSKTPDIELEFTIEHRSQQELTRQLIRTYDPYHGYRNQVVNAPTTIQIPTLIVAPWNRGKVIAEHVHIFMKIPNDILAASVVKMKVEDGYAYMSDENVFRDILEVDASGKFMLGQPRVIPILPEIRGPFGPIELAKNPLLDDREIKWKVYADTALMKSGSIKLSEIKKNN